MSFAEWMLGLHVALCGVLIACLLHVRKEESLSLIKLSCELDEVRGGLRKATSEMIAEREALIAGARDETIVLLQEELETAKAERDAIYDTVQATLPMRIAEAENNGYDNGYRDGLRASGPFEDAYMEGVKQAVLALYFRTGQSLEHHEKARGTQRDRWLMRAMTYSSAARGLYVWYRDHAYGASPDVSGGPPAPTELPKAGSAPTEAPTGAEEPLQVFPTEDLW